MPAILDRSPLMVRSPAAVHPGADTHDARQAGDHDPQNYSVFGFRERFRELVKQRVTNPAKRRIFWETRWKAWSPRSVTVMRAARRRCCNRC